jgi:hypothetical protein
MTKSVASSDQLVVGEVVVYLDDQVVQIVCVIDHRSDGSGSAGRIESAQDIQ